MTRPFTIGLTGSIGMGKTTTAQMFARHGAAVWDADEAVHRLYSTGGAAVAPMAEAFPSAVHDNAITREALKHILRDRPDALAQIEAIVHPLVAADRAAFIAQTSSDLVVLDIPLLFETGLDQSVDHIVVASAPANVQRSRVMARPGMTEAQLDLILSKQLPDAEKRAKADHVIDTTSLETAEAAVQSVVEQIRQAQHARNRT